MNSPATLHLQRDFTASCETVFDAWVNPKIMRRWLFASIGNEFLRFHVQARVGGKFSLLENDGHQAIDHFGQYFEIDRPRRLVFTLSVPKHFQGESLVTVEITALLEGCSLSFTQAGVEPAITRRSWLKMFDQLDAILVEH
jgi:uncharacterized protein YndB with AHSA1/START domain